jgi:serine/threonine-protein kinase RsbW
MDIGEKTVRAVIPADAQYIDVVRLIIYGITKKMGFSFEEIEDIKVAVTEACNNAALYAYVDEDSGEIDVQIEICKGKFRIKVMDTGKSFDVNRISNQANSLYDRQINEVDVGGLGIFLMRSLMDEVQIQKKSGTEVVMTKWLKKHA